MTTSMTVLVVIVSACLFVSLFAGGKHKPVKPLTIREEAIGIALRWLFAAWCISEFGSYALQPYGVEIGYWQAFFGFSAIQMLVLPPHQNKWTEWLAFKVSEGTEK